MSTLKSRTRRTRVGAIIGAGTSLAVLISALVAAPATTAAPAPPTITGISPGAGRATTAVAIAGRGFSGATEVLFGTKPVIDPDVRSSTTIVATAPEGISGTLDVRVVTPAGTSAMTGADRFTVQSAPKALRWTKPATIDPHATLTSVSCPSPTFCMAVDRSGYAIAHTRGKWQAPKRIDTHGKLTAVSCSSYTFCATVDTAGYAFVYRSGKWSHATRAYTRGLVAVSCPTHLVCVAVGTAGREVGWNGTRWQTPGRLSSTTTLTGVSCPTAAACVVVGRNGANIGQAFQRTAPGHWLPAVAFKGNALAGVDCQTATACVATSSDEDGWEAFFLRGMLWSPREVLGGTGENDAVQPYLSCPTSAFCLVATTFQYSRHAEINAFDAANSAPTDPPGLLAKGQTYHGISCATASNCVVLSGRAVARGTR